jgi:SNF2 family DNA or RNA helicase
LIVAPNHLCDQWVKEYYNKFKNDKRVVIVITLDQYKGLQLSDILFADIVVVSYQLLINIYHKRKVGYGETNLQELQKMDVLKVLQSKLWSDFKKFYWNNIILDEVHEVNSSGYKFTTILDQIHSTCVWNVTGTPFPNGINSFLDLMYNTTSYKTRRLDLDTIVNAGMNEDLVDISLRLFRRNTKQSVLSELKTNVITEKVLKLDFTLQERTLYDSYKQNVREKFYDFLIKICCHPELYNDTREMVKNCKSLDEIQDVILKHNKNKIDALKLTITNSEHHIKTYESMLIGQWDEQVIESINVKITSTKKRLTNDKKTLSDITRTYQYLKNAIDELRNKNDLSLSCPVCLDEIPEKDMTVTMCGHKFCWECVYQNYKINSHTRQFKCPFCNTFMDTKDVYIISQQATSRKSEGELNGIINDVKSTKIGNIIYFLKNKKDVNPNDKIILFSQWDELLHKVGSKLQEYDLKISYCNGTVYQKQRAIDDFKNNDTNIIMLSSRNAASGINLTNANTIIFLEPVYGTSEYRKDIEYQAIGRADRIGQTNKIKVFRFIIRDTIEEDIVENSISVRQIS